MPSVALAQRDLKDIPPPDPELERRSFQVAEGFEVNLFAADPLLAKPIQMAWDARGRLWIASSETYPHIKPGQKADDKILVLEDTDNDGKADKTTVFADGLLIPTGVESNASGTSAYVANSTELLELTDTDGDGKADQERILLSGFGTEDTHHMIHTFRHGPDGLFYFNQSIYIHSHIETPYGVRRLNAGGTWQFRPETMQLEVFDRGLVNHWGTAWDRWGATFHTDGAGNEGINYTFNGAVFTTAYDTTRIVRGLNPGSPKYCGLEFTSGRHLPEDWQGNAITNDFRAHRVVRYVLSEDGSGYAAKEMPELIKSDHVAFRPIDVKMGPDGAIYIADWYNPIIQHGEVDFRDPRRDKTHGRIWRVTAKGRPLVEKPKLVGATNEVLFEHLKAPEDWTRHYAKRMLKERAEKSPADRQAVVAALKTWVKRIDWNVAGQEHFGLEALWIYQALDAPEFHLLDHLIYNSNSGASAAAIRVYSHWHDRFRDLEGALLPRLIRGPRVLLRLKARIDDERPRVRLETVRACSTIRSAESAAFAMKALDQPIDRFLDFALWQTARDLKSYWLPEVLAGRNPFEKIEHLTFALKAIGSPDVVPPLVKLLTDGKVPAEQVEGVLDVIATGGGPKELAAVLDWNTGNKRATEPARQKLLKILVRAADERGIAVNEGAGPLAALLHDGQHEVETRSLAARLAGLWKTESLRGDLARYARGAGTSEELRLASIEALARLGGADSSRLLRELIAGDGPLAIRVAAVRGLTMIDATAAAPEAVELLADSAAESDVRSLVEPFLLKKADREELATALEGKKLPADAARVALGVIRGVPGGDEALVGAISAAGGLGGPRVFSPAEMASILADASKSGNPHRGEEVYRRADLQCLKCHAIGGAGGQVGPDMISLGSSAQPDYILESLVEPSKRIKENYNAMLVIDDDGKQYAGIRVVRSGKELVLRDAEDRQIAIPADRIDTEEDSPTSLMPTGLVDSLAHQELVDLVRFLSELGKQRDFAVGRTPVVRRWQTPAPVPEVFTKLNRIGLHVTFGEASEVSWASTYSKVSGQLPLNELTPMRYGANAEPVAVARAQLEVSSAGKVVLRFNGREGLRLWVGDKQVELADETVIDLSAGLHNLVVAVNLNERKAPLRLEMVDTRDATAKAAFVIGK
ncbi:MAG: PVC-type heme-binding CxxCH protein [Pirellulales bacterium]